MRERFPVCQRDGHCLCGRFNAAYRFGIVENHFDAVFRRCQVPGVPGVSYFEVIENILLLFRPGKRQDKPLIPKLASCPNVHSGLICVI
jgi:hypothetical protein